MSTGFQKKSEWDPHNHYENYQLLMRLVYKPCRKKQQLETEKDRTAIPTRPDA